MFEMPLPVAPGIPWMPWIPLKSVLAPITVAVELSLKVKTKSSPEKAPLTIS